MISAARRRAVRVAVCAGLLATVLITVTAVFPQAPGETARAPEPAATPAPPLRFGVASFYNPRSMYQKYQPLADYLSRHSGRRWELDISISYQAAIDALCSGEVTVAYLGPFAYLRAHERCGAVPVAQLLTRSQTTYRSMILVRNDSGIRSIADLRGARFAFGAPLSTSSHLLPRAMLLDAGIGGEDIHCLFFGHHERAARAVLMGEADACGVRDTVGRRFVERGLRSIATSEGIPNFPLAVRPELALEVRLQLDDALVDLPARDLEAARELRTLDEELRSGFRRAEDADYDPVRALAAKVFGEGAAGLPEDQLGCPAGVR